MASHAHRCQHKRPRHDRDGPSNDDAMAESHPHVHPAALANNPFMPIFTSFRDELDEHHDRRERVIKASRDITALSKKMIFTMQRYLAQRTSQIRTLFTSILPDIPAGTLNSYRYQRNISAGIQEYLEATSFHHYLTTGTLITLEEAQKALPDGINLTIEDYMGGIFDLVGELMRLGITIIATTPLDKDDHGTTPKILSDLREFRNFFESLDTQSGGGYSLGKEVDKKLGVMRICVEKVEMAVYGMLVRGQERPMGWMPDVSIAGDVGGGAGAGGGGGNGGGFRDGDDD
ncbi:Translin [Kalaharituber pfeilii]|nr:Translin [Kalaharituber pfeilii]